VLALAALASGAAQAQQDEDEDGGAQPPASAPAAAPVRMEVSEDGTLVIDARSKVAWSRCLEGTRWNGKTCAGLPRLFTRSEAQAVARERSQAEGVPWRLPRATELRHLVQRRAVPPGVDSVLFPSSPGTCAARAVGAQLGLAGKGVGGVAHLQHVFHARLHRSHGLGVAVDVELALRGGVEHLLRHFGCRDLAAAHGLVAHGLADELALGGLFRGRSPGGCGGSG
jgi:hypothetical protein